MITENNTVSTSETTTVKSVDANAGEVRLSEIKSIDASALSTLENKELLKESSSVKDQQGRHRGRGYERRERRDVDVTVVARNDEPRYSDGYHSHSTAYIGGGGVLILIIILILIL